MTLPPEVLRLLGDDATPEKECAACGHLKLLHYEGDGCAFPVLYDADEPEPPPCGCKEFKP